MGKLNQTAVQVQELLDKVSAAQNAEKSATDLALMQDIPNTDDFAKTEQLPKSIAMTITKQRENDLEGSTIYSVDTEVDFSTIRIGDTIFANIDGSMDTVLLTVGNITRMGSSLSPRINIMGHGVMSIGWENTCVTGALQSDGNQLVILPTSTGQSTSDTEECKAETVWEFMSSGMDMEGNPVLEAPSDFINNAVAGDMVLVNGCRGVVIDNLPQLSRLQIGSKVKYMMVFTPSSIDYYKVTQDEVTLVSTIPYQQENANAQRVWNFEYAGDNNGYVIPDGWAENAKMGDCVVVHEEHVGFITWLAEDKVGGRLITFDSNLNVRYISFKKGILMADDPIQISTLGSRVKALEQSSVTLTRAEYDALATKNPNTTYYITDDGGLLL